MYKLEIVRSLDRFKELKYQWDELLSKSSSDNIFLTWEWQFNWWQAFNIGKILHIILIRDENGELLGIAPLYIAIKKILNLISYNELRFIGYGGNHATSEYLGFICDKNKQETLINEILSSIFNGLKSWQAVVFSDISDDASVKTSIIKYAKDNKLSNLVKDDKYVCPIIKITSGWDDYFASLPRTMRYNLQKYERRLRQNFTIEFSKFNTLNNSDGAFSHFQRLYSERRNRKQEENKYDLEKYKNFQQNIIKSISDREWLYLSLLSLDKKVVAALYGFRYKGTLYLYQMGYDNEYAKFGIGNILINLSLRDGLKDRINECDLLRGDEWYKMRWANGIKRKNTIMISNSNIGNTYITYYKARNKCIRIIKRILPKSVKRIIEDKLYK